MPQISLKVKQCFGSDTVIDSFREAINRVGLQPDKIKADGQLHRCRVDGKLSKTDGAYVFHPDAPASGWFLNFCTGYSSTWCSKTEMSDEERAILAERARIDRQNRDREQAERSAKAAELAAKRWDSAKEADTHHYLTRKGVKPHGVRVNGVGDLLIPVRDEQGALTSLQTIDSKGDKRFLTGGRIKGCFFEIPAVKKAQDGPLYIVEGYATAASVHEATGCHAVVAFNAENLAPVAKTMRTKYPNREIVICADDDHKTEGNPGLTKATDAALVINARLAVPEFTDKTGRSDFNDLHAEQGLAAVRACLERSSMVGNPAPGSALPGQAKKNHSSIILVPWPDPLPLPPARPAAPALDPAICPPALLPWWKDVAERAQAPLESIAAASIVVLSSLVGRQIVIHPKAVDNWTITPNLWGMIIGRPSTMKTLAVKVASSPLARLVARAQEEHRAESHKAMSRDTVFKIRQDELEKKLKTAIKNDAHQDEIDDLTAQHAALLAEKEASGRIVERTYSTSDTTTEKLGELLRDNPRGLLLLRDELAGWLRGLCRQGREGDREFFLESWSGDTPFRQDRIARGSVTIQALCISILGSIQPSKIESYIRGAVNGTMEDDGLLQRFQLLVWPEQVGKWDDIDRRPDPIAFKAYSDIHGALADLNPSTLGATTPEQGQPYMRFSSDAQVWFNTWREKLENRLRSPELAASPAFEAHLGKYKKLVPALALIFHLVDCVTTGASGPVSPQATSLALAWADFLEGHARKIYAEELQGGLTPARALALKIKDGVVNDGDTLRSLYRPQWAGITKADQALEAAKTLEGLNWLRITLEGDGPRKANCVRFNPALVDWIKAGKSGL